MQNYRSRSREKYSQSEAGDSHALPAFGWLSFAASFDASGRIDASARLYKLLAVKTLYFEPRTSYVRL